MSDPPRTALVDWHLPDPERAPEFYADVPLKRLLAFVIDSAVIFALSLFAVVLTAFIGLFFFPFLFLCLGFVYRWVTISRAFATWGMRLMGIEFRRADGTRLDGMTAALHTGLFTLACAMPVIQLVSMGFMAFHPRGQGLPDIMLDTTALNCRARG
ncbi:RDD family protein [Roseovarius sp. SCSIO 43702]|uniref:RDD family protein n=1 Tax=Roseovarius sp. SCSIO 43702 TaxID=2823043 RepID=UPI001C72D8AD|nr:RDD family protein [Roseovarius sp. SCSIO 43702]QYX58421.1 RDD family protein [Roseovarius sp. SCSIO 43702]